MTGRQTEWIYGVAENLVVFSCQWDPQVSPCDIFLTPMGALYWLFREPELWLFKPSQQINLERWLLRAKRKDKTLATEYCKKTMESWSDFIKNYREIDFLAIKIEHRKINTFARLELRNQGPLKRNPGTLRWEPPADYGNLTDDFEAALIRAQQTWGHQ